MGWIKDSKKGPTAYGQINAIDKESKKVDRITEKGEVSYRYSYEFKSKDSDLRLSAQWIKEGQETTKSLK